MFLTGNEAAVLGAIDAGATMMFGYPITPATEILQGWIVKSESDSRLVYLQTEDEIAAGFAVLGSVLVGKKAFTASAGPGHILLQDPLSMAESERLPFVGIMMQRGGPSTGTVNFSQQEVTLAAFGGNGDGLRVVYSASTVEEMYYLTIKSFSTAWKYRFPTILLGDGYLGKMKSNVTLTKPLHPVSANSLLDGKGKPKYIRNCFSSEEDLAEVLRKNIGDWNAAKSKIAESETFKTADAKTLIVAHGLVASAAKEAVILMRKNGLKTGLFRPITLNPFDRPSFIKASKKAKKIIIIESSLNQFARILKYETSDLCLNFTEIAKPAEGFTANEIVVAVRRLNG